jgi:orotidine-5'-phosphate decarboxylase
MQAATAAEPMPATWCEIVRRNVARHGLLVMGVDPLRERVPDAFDGEEFWLRTYLDVIIEEAADQVGFVKFQSAYYEALGLKGLQALSEAMAKARALGLGVILDAKRGDIGATAVAYAQAFLSPGADFEADCLTINPFMGPDTLAPFVEAAVSYGKGLFILCRTSNHDAGWLQDRLTGNRTIAELCAELIGDLAAQHRDAQGLSPIGAVVGATIASEAAKLRRRLPDSIILAPGLGAQGGDPGQLSALKGAAPHQLLIPISRGLLAVDDRTLSGADYLDGVRGRLTTFRKALA